MTKSINSSFFPLLLIALTVLAVDAQDNNSDVNVAAIVVPIVLVFVLVPIGLLVCLQIMRWRKMNVGGTMQQHPTGYEFPLRSTYGPNYMQSNEQQQYDPHGSPFPLTRTYDPNYTPTSVRQQNDQQGPMSYPPSSSIVDSINPHTQGQMKIVNRAPLVLDPSNRNVFSYDDISKMTNNFGKKIGQGGSGSVYHDRLTGGGREVAVKVHMETGAKEFVTEVQLLLTVHHKCIARFVGYCDGGQNLILVYEYMKGGNLRQLLSGHHLPITAICLTTQGSKSRILTWEKRLQMAKDVATGLDYLHSQCDPSIIHRDVKTTNILLNEKLEAKIADFGLSNSGFDEDATYVSTVVAGTPGYLDPEYYATNKLTKKIDVYSFGVVLFELISGHSPIMTTPQGRRCSLVQWIKPLIERGDLEGVPDPNLAGQYDADSLWKVAETAAACAAESSDVRPTMADVVSQLKEASVIKVKRELKVADDQLSTPSATRQLLAGSSIPAVDETVPGSTSSAERSGTYNQYLAPPLAR